MSHCYAGDETFPLYEEIQRATPHTEVEDYNWYAASEIPAIRMDMLVYFAASIFWRSSAHRWGLRDTTPLGPYEESFRKFLMGEEDLPKTMALIISVIPPDSQVCGRFRFPEQVRIKAGYYRTDFNLLGIAFDLLLGKGVFPGWKGKCAYHSPEKFVRAGDLIAGGMRAQLHEHRNAEFKGKLKKVMGTPE